MTLDTFANLKTIETLKESQKRTGESLSTLRMAVWAGAIPSVKRGGAHWVSPADVDAWLAAHYGPARERSRGRPRKTATPAPAAEAEKVAS